MWANRTDTLVIPKLTAWKDKQHSQVAELVDALRKANKGCNCRFESCPDYKVLNKLRHGIDDNLERRVFSQVNGKWKPTHPGDAEIQVRILS